MCVVQVMAKPASSDLARETIMACHGRYRGVEQVEYQAQRMHCIKQREESAAEVHPGDRMNALIRQNDCNTSRLTIYVAGGPRTCVRLGAWPDQTMGLD